MNDDARAKRMAVRFTDDDLAWLAENAEDEGVEPATLVRMIVNRLRRGRAPLMSMISVPQRAVTFVTGEVSASALRQAFDPGEEPVDAAADEVLAKRLGELEGSNVQHLYADDAAGDELQTAAVPLRRIARTQYNPGRG